MSYVTIKREGAVASVTLSRGKVNALNEAVITELQAAFEELEADESVRALILTGTGKFFSFGFDIPEFFHYSREDFTRYLRKFADLYRHLFLYPKPVVAVLNGHTIAGACMLATACDARLMVGSAAKISLNEITFGSTVFSGSVETLAFCVGRKNAQRVLYSGALFSAQEALEMGLVDLVVSEENLASEARKLAHDFAAKDPRAFRSIKLLLRTPVADLIQLREQESIEEFVDIWYAESTREQLKGITIRS